MTYWEERARANERNAEKLASTYSRREKKLYADALKAIEIELNDLLLDLATGITPTRTELWRAGKYLKLRSAIQKQANILADGQIGLMDELLSKAYEETLETALADFLVGEEQLSSSLRARALNSVWSGKTYSERVWQNRDALAEKVSKSISDMIVLGKSPTEIKKQLREEFGVSYRVADRLIRTETSHIYNSASLDAYKQAGVRQVKYLHGGTCSGKCDCHSLDGKIFDIGTEPTLPRHPNCVCCYAPVIDLTTPVKRDIIQFSEEDLEELSASFPKRGKAINPNKATITHGGTHADKQLLKRGITLEDAQHYVDTAIICFQQSEDKTMYLSNDGVAVVLDNGGLATAYPASWFDENITGLLNEVKKKWRK